MLEDKNKDNENNNNDNGNNTNSNDKNKDKWLSIKKQCFIYSLFDSKTIFMKYILIINL